VVWSLHTPPEHFSQKGQLSCRLSFTEHTPRAVHDRHDPQSMFHPQPPAPLHIPVLQVPVEHSPLTSSLEPWFAHWPLTHFWHVPQSPSPQQAGHGPGVHVPTAVQQEVCPPQVATDTQMSSAPLHSAAFTAAAVHW
jgi:hypothetical protein